MNTKLNPNLNNYMKKLMQDFHRERRDEEGTFTCDGGLVFETARNSLEVEPARRWSRKSEGERGESLSQR